MNNKIPKYDQIVSVNVRRSKLDREIDKILAEEAAKSESLVA